MKPSPDDSLAQPPPDDSLPRPSSAQLYRRPLEAFEARLPLPRVAPMFWTVGSVVVSALAFTPVVDDNAARAVLVGVVLLADWLDGATARRYGAERGGQVMDVVADRISEIVIFAADRTSFGQLMFALAVANTVLVAVGRTRGRHWALPLRFVYLVALVLGLPNRAG